MRQRNQIEATSCTRDIEFATDHVLQLCAVDELNDRESPDGNDETRLQNSNLIIHPRPAVAYLIWRWDAVGAAGIFAGETAADGGEINLRSNVGFVHSAKLFEPTEECFASSVRKRSFQCRFPRTRGLSNDHYVADDRAAGDWRRLHPRAAAAFQQCRYVPFEFGLKSLCSHRPVGRSHLARRDARSDGPHAPGLQDRPKTEPSAPKDREERQNQTQDDAENDAGNDGKIERRMSALDSNIAGQSAQPFWGEATPHHQPNQCGGNANDHDELSHFAHHSKVARSKRTHKFDNRCPSSFETTTRHSACRKRLAKRRFAALFASSHASITRTWPRTKRPLKKNSRRSTKRTKF